MASNASPEVKSILIRTHDLTTALSNEPLGVAGILLGKGLISRDIWSKMLLHSYTSAEKAAILVEAVGNTIRIAPAKFQCFLEILADQVCAKEVVESLRSTYQSIYPDDPKPKDLVYELEKVDWKQLGIQLNVPRHILRNIDQKNPGNESMKLSEVLQYWIDNAEPAASWEKILEALQRIGGHANIIANIQSKYNVSQPPRFIPQFQTIYPIVSASSVAKENVHFETERVLSLVDQLEKFPAGLRDHPCADAHLVELSNYIIGYMEWENLSPYLRLSKMEIDKIVAAVRDVIELPNVTGIPEFITRPESTVVIERCTSMLRKWKDKFGKDANYGLLITALHEAKEIYLIEKLQLIVMHFSKFPAGLLDIPCADVLLDKFSDSSIERQELSLLTPESDQEKEILKAFSLNAQCKEALCLWRKNCRDKANYRCLITVFSKVHRVDLIDKLECIVKLSWYGGYLKKQYKEVFFSSRVFANKWLPSPTQKIFKLAIIKKEKILRGRIDNEFVQKTIRGQVDDILLEKSPIELKDIFKNTEGERKVILIDGAPGSGKSTLTVHICQQWGRGELFNEFIVVLLVQL